MDFDFQDTIDTTTGLMEFRTSNAGATLNINREARTIKNVIIARVGEAKGHGVHIEQSFIKDSINYAKKKMGGRVPVYMGHRWDPNFYQMGFLYNIREEGDMSIGDLKIYESADLSPAGGGMPEWFFSIAEEDPSAVNMSMSFAMSAMYQYDKQGNAVDLEFDYYNWRWKKIDEKGKMYVRFGSWNSTDIVHKGALTDTLFSAEGDTPAAVAFTHFANADGFIDWYKHNMSRFPKLNAFYQAQNKQGFFSTLKSYFSNQTTNMDNTNPAPAAESKPATEVQASEAVDIDAKISAALKPLQDKVATLETQLSAKDAEIAELKKKPAATPVPVKEDGASRQEMTSKDEEPWMNSPMNKRIAEMSRKQPAAKA